MKLICTFGFLLILAGIMPAQEGSASPEEPDSLNSIFSTKTAVEPLGTSTTSSAFEYVVAHFPLGGGFNTQVMFANSGSKTANVQVSFLNTAGASAAVPLAGKGLQSSQSFTIQPNDVQGLSGDPSKRNSSLEVSWATVTSSAPLNVFSLFDFGPNPPAISGAVGAQSTPAAKSFRLPILERNAGSGNPANYEVGLAIANPNSSTTTVTVKVLNPNGSLKGSFQEVLAAKNQTIFTLSSKLTFDSSLFTGSVAVCATQPIGLVTIGFEGGQAFFTTSVTNDPCP